MPTQLGAGGLQPPRCALRLVKKQNRIFVATRCPQAAAAGSERRVYATEPFKLRNVSEIFFVARRTRRRRRRKSGRNVNRSIAPEISPPKSFAPFASFARLSGWNSATRGGCKPPAREREDSSHPIR
jgi:hypothetical protein